MSIFDIMGPIMIGPSSSHTAGAVKLGIMASLLFKEKVERADIFFHGSFAETYQGHGTAKAVIGGILGFLPEDERIKDALALARKEGIKFSFQEIQIRDAHPNTLKISLTGKAKELSLIGSSIGGGNIIISWIDNYQVKITGKFPTLWILHQDRPGELGIITSIIGKNQLNIAYMEVFRQKRGSIGSSIIQLDQKPDARVLEQLRDIESINQVRYLPPL